MRITPSVSRTAALVVLVVTILAGSPTPVIACVPAPSPAPGATRPLPTATPTIAQAAAQAEVVFRGHPIRREDASYKVIDSPATRTTFAIDTLWKGPATPEVTVLTYSCSGDSNPFAASGMYIVYASKGRNGELVPLAGVSRPASASDQEDAVLGPGAIPPTQVPGATRPPPTATSVPPTRSGPFPTPVPPFTPIAAAVSSPPALAATGSSGPVSAATPTLSPSTDTATSGAGDGARSGLGSRVPILLIAAAIVVVGGLIIVARMRQRTRPE
ncbi:MAG: hypothetical protein ACYDAR_01660 [Thermomicrobiales bacterium]